jgi:hypothetical protein
VGRSPEEHRRRARKYGRRARLLAAGGSRAELDREVERLVQELRASCVDKAEVSRLRAELRAATDDRRRRAAIWAIVDALEAVGEGR